MCYRNAPDNVLPKPAYGAGSELEYLHTLGCAPENSNAQITDASIIDRTDVNRNPQSEIYIQLQTQAELTPMKPIASQTAPMEPIASQTARENSNAQIIDASIIDRTDRNPPELTPSKRFIRLKNQAELTPMKPIASQTAPMKPIASQTARENSNAQIIDASIIDRTDRNPPELTPSKRFIRLKNQAELTPMKPIASQTEPGVIVDLITPDKPANRIPITSMTPSKELGTLMNRTLSFESGNYF